jgi:hypothetical protein
MGGNERGCYESGEDELGEHICDLRGKSKRTE